MCITNRRFRINYVTYINGQYIIQTLIRWKHLSELKWIYLLTFRMRNTKSSHVVECLRCWIDMYFTLNIYNLLSGSWHTFFYQSDHIKSSNMPEQYGNRAIWRWWAVIPFQLLFVCPTFGNCDVFYDWACVHFTSSVCCVISAWYVLLAYNNRDRGGGNYSHRFLCNIINLIISVPIFGHLRIITNHIYTRKMLLIHVFIPMLV